MLPPCQRADIARYVTAPLLRHFQLPLIIYAIIDISYFFAFAIDIDYFQLSSMINIFEVADCRSFG